MDPGAAPVGPFEGPEVTKFQRAQEFQPVAEGVGDVEAAVAGEVAVEAHRVPGRLAPGGEPHRPEGSVYSKA